MAISFDNIEIPAGKSGEDGGAIFSLSDPAGVDAEFKAPEGEVVVRENSLGVVVSNLDASNHETAWRKGLIAAQRALDVFSARGLADLHLQEPQYDHIAVYGRDGGQVLRVVGVATLNIQVGPLKAEVRNQAGELVPQPPPVSVWHESMRYYRQAQLSDDLFESFRSLWLGVENLLDSLEPAMPGEREKAWLKRALTKADAAIELKRFLPRGLEGKPVDTAYKYFYDETRTHLFHAKASRLPLLPYEEVGTNLLASRHGQLTGLYSALLEHVTRVRRSRNVLLKGGFELMVAGFERGPMAILVTNDPGPGGPSDIEINPQGGQVVEVPADREAQLERPFLRVFLGSFEGSKVAALKHLRKTAYKSDGDLISAHIVEGDLRISDLVALQVQMGLRVRSGGLPKAFAEM